MTTETNWLSLDSSTYPQADDETLSLDVSDTTMHPSGTVKRTLVKDSRKRVIVSLTVADHPYTATTNDDLIFVDASGGAVTVNLYTAVGNEGRPIQIKKTDTSLNDVTIDGNLSETIDSNLTLIKKQRGTSTIVADGANWESIQSTSAVVPTPKDETLITGAIGVHYVFGYYKWATADANLTQAAPTATIGAAGISYGGHAGIVAGAAGTASGGAGAVEIEASGTSITDAGVETTSDTEIIVADITTMSTNDYYETVKKWTGVVTFTLKNASGSTQTTFAADINYGLSAYEDRENRDFTVTGLSMQIMGGAADTGFDIELLHHKVIGWTYAATSFVPGNGPIAQLSTDSPTNKNLAIDEPMRWKRDNLSTDIIGEINEGYVCRVTTGANNSVRTSNLAVSVTF